MKGSIRKRPSGSWELRYDGPDGVGGKRKQITETVRGTRKEAERVMRDGIASMEKGAHVAKDAVPMSEFLFGWLQTYAATNTRLRTQVGYSGHIRRYIVPAIGHVQLQKVQPRQIQELYASMLSRGLSERTVLHVHRLVKQALSHAVKWGLLIRNPAEAVIPPRAEQNEVAMWDVPTLRRFLKVAGGSRYGDIYELGILTGLRRGELLGLGWNSIDFDAGYLMVVRTLQRIDGHGLVLDKPKTRKSKRSVALSPASLTLLRRIRVRQAELRLAAGEAWQDDGFVFTQADGSPIDPNRVTRDFQKIVGAAGLPHLTLKGLRHAHATLLLVEGVHPKVVSERLGHSNISTTMDIYSHVIPGLQEKAALVLDERLGLGVGRS